MVMAGEGWKMWTDPDSVWLGNIPVAPLIRRLYLIQMGIWIWTAFSHRFLEARHKDYFVMYAHHIVTLLLIAGSYHLEYNRIGVLVLFLHDASDIVIDLMKMFNIIGLDEKSGTYL